MLIQRKPAAALQDPNPALAPRRGLEQLCHPPSPALRRGAQPREVTSLLPSCPGPVLLQPSIIGATGTPRGQLVSCGINFIRRYVFFNEIRGKKKKVLTTDVLFHLQFTAACIFHSWKRLICRCIQGRAGSALEGSILVAHLGERHLAECIAVPKANPKCCPHDGLKGGSSFPRPLWVHRGGFSRRPSFPLWLPGHHHHPLNLKAKAR